MISLKTAFGVAAAGKQGSSVFWLLVWALVILDAGDEARRKRGRDAANSTASARA
jgi:hypothetical protein